MAWHAGERQSISTVPLSVEIAEIGSDLAWLELQPYGRRLRDNACNDHLPPSEPDRFAHAPLRLGPILCLDREGSAVSCADKVATLPRDLAVETVHQQALAINLKTAKAIGLDIPRLLLTRADVTR